MATFADDTAIMSSDHNPNTTSQKFQQHLNLLQNWMEQWKITVNLAKSTQIAFTTRRISVRKLISTTSLYLSNKKLNI
jgi:hypothetical protein